MHSDTARILERVRELAERHRATCLWYLRPDYVPTTRAEALAVLDAIATHGDRRAFQEAEELRRWLSPDSSSPSVA